MTVGNAIFTVFQRPPGRLKDNQTYESVTWSGPSGDREIGFRPAPTRRRTSIRFPQEHGQVHVELGSDEEFESLYSAMKVQDSIKFWSTSFLRGVTLDNAVIIDEMQNLNLHELDSIITRVGEGPVSSSVVTAASLTPLRLPRRVVSTTSCVF